jgi:hypothetical protein
MNRRRVLALLATVVGGAGSATADEPKFFGVACMASDGTIDLRFRAPLPGGGGFGEGTLHYATGDPHYREVIDHIGGLHPGECKDVPPWPDPAPAR